RLRRSPSCRMRCERSWKASGRSSRTSCHRLSSRAKIFNAGIISSGHSCHGNRTNASTQMTVSSPNAIEIKLDRLMDEMRFLRSQMIAFDRRLNGIEAYLKPSEPSEQQPESKSRPWFAAAARATARTVFVLFAVGAATGAVLHYLGT